MVEGIVRLSIFIQPLAECDCVQREWVSGIPSDIELISEQPMIQVSVLQKWVELNSNSSGTPALTNEEG
jgi:hypothetical protein